MEHASTTSESRKTSHVAGGGARPCEVCGGPSFHALGAKAEHRFERCTRCRLERIEPQPTDETLAQIYGKHYYDAWGLQTDQSAVEHLKRGTFTRVIRGAGDLPRGSRVLDCGAATGFLMGVAQDMGLSPYGAELSEYGAEQIANRFGRDRVHQGHLEDAKFPDGHFEAIFMCDFLEHVRAPERVLDRAYSLLARGGKIVISMPRIGSLTHKAMGLKWTHYKVEHLYYFSIENLRQLLERMGFEDFRGKTLVKTMNLRYIAHQFDVYPHPVLTPLVRTLSRVTPSSFQRQTFPIAMGELVAYATKR